MQPAPPTTMAELMQALVSLAATVITIGTPILLAYIHIRFGVANAADKVAADANRARTLATAADAGARLADNFASERGGYANPAVKQAAIAWGARHVQDTMAETLAHFNSDPTALVRARIDVTVPALDRPASDPPASDPPARSDAVPPLGTPWVSPPRKIVEIDGGTAAAPFLRSTSLP
jgi:hypothetical protein